MLHIVRTEPFDQIVMRSFQVCVDLEKKLGDFLNKKVISDYNVVSTVVWQVLMDSDLTMQN